MNRFVAGPLAVGLLAAGAWLPSHSGRAAEAPAWRAAFRRSPYFGEWVRYDRSADGIRRIVQLPADYDSEFPTRLVIYATPNGTTAEMALGEAKSSGRDWRYDTQHVAAQIRELRTQSPGVNVAVCVIQPEGRSWPAWRTANGQPSRLPDYLKECLGVVPGQLGRVDLTAHSGGGSLLFGLLEAAAPLPPAVRSLIFLDANYNFTDAAHGERLATWLGDPDHALRVVSYDDRRIMLDGKLVVGPQGGTYRATDRMLAAFRSRGPVSESRMGDLERFSALDGRARWVRDLNPSNRILHTVLVEENGLLDNLTDTWSRRPQSWTLRRPRAYSRWIQPAAPVSVRGARLCDRMPARPAEMQSGQQFWAGLMGRTRDEREAAISEAMRKGNIPPFLRQFAEIETRMTTPDGRAHAARIWVSPDYLGTGGDQDWVRAPMTPQTAQGLADRWGCALPTRRLVDAIHASAAVRGVPQPMTAERELAGTFLQHHRLIQTALPPDSAGKLTSGIKKDVVLSNRIWERENRVAIYGWHQPSGDPIQPLTTVHVNWYVDYSHGVRLIDRRMEVDGKPRDYAEILRDPVLWPLVSDEGPLLRTHY